MENNDKTMASANISNPCRDNEFLLAYDWPGKKDDQAGEHPAVWHMLDVAACAEILIEKHHAFASLSPAQRTAMVVLAALHDIGKISNTFRGLLRNGRPGAYRHWQLSDTLLCKALDSQIARAFGSDLDTRSELYAAVSGHHGGPERSGDRFEVRKRMNAIGEEAKQSSKEWVAHMLDLFPSGSLEEMDQKTARKISWALSGLTIAADWVASNIEWFPYCASSMSPPDYLARARSRAADAMELAGLDQAAATSGTDARELLDMPELRPMQAVAENVVLPGGPLLVLVEDATGSGKTEAASILAHRMISTGRAHGLFFALPTMATANAMFERMAVIAKRFFLGEPSLTLAHSRAKLHPGFRRLIGAADDRTPEAVEFSSTRWLADDRRRALLAEVGVGTIDQALLGILPTRFATLRLFGLLNHVLIVDEAHSYDPYMQKQLETLLRMQAMNGGSAIVMTATLPLGMRQAYANAFRQGLGHKPKEVEHQDYPALATVGQSIKAQPVKPVPATCRTIRVERISSTESAIDLLTTSASKGAACLWVRNAVDDAIAAAEQLRRLGCPSGLLHARFVLCDRLRHEDAVMTRFGRDGHGRKGQVLVATQVVEASLDIDFDVIVSDLAPIGSLIQRAGRLWRHMDKHPGAERPVANPKLMVLSPNPDQVTDADWAKGTLGRGAYVYRLNDLWLTARALFDDGEIRAPEGLRTLISKVHGRDAIDVPDPLKVTQMEAEGEKLATAAHAQHNVVTPEEGYLNGTGDHVWSDEKFPTRLGKEEAILVLARYVENELRPWCDRDLPEATAWALSEVRCHKRRLPEKLPDQSAPHIAKVKATWPKGKQKYLILCPVSEDGEICEGLRYDPDSGLIFSA